ncbi:MAG: pilus assembly protein PilM [Planctomycetota bacterium]|nr:pilus assembly protein PilM [Planctomycetota bacterium]
MNLAMGLTSKKLLAIDWDARHVRIVVFRPRADGIDLVKAVSVPIPSNVVVTDAESLGAFLRQVLRQARITVKKVLLTVSRDRLVLNTINLPPTPAEELAAMVQFQVAKELPFSADDATIDFAVSGEYDAKAPCDLLVAAIRNEELSFYRKVAHEAGLSIQRIGLRPHGNLAAVTKNWPETSRDTFLLVEVGPALTEIDIVRKGVLQFSRSASVSLSELGESPQDRTDDSRIVSTAVHDRSPDDSSRQAVDVVLKEVTLSYEGFRATDPTLQIGHIVVAGSSGIEKEVAQSLGARFGVRAELYAADRALNLSPQRSRELRGFSAALGLAMSHGEKGLSHFDFLHPKRPESKRTRQWKKAPIAAVVAVVFIATGVVVRGQYVTPRVRLAEQLRVDVKAKKITAEAVQEFEKRVNVLREWQHAEQHWPTVLAALTRLFPPEQEGFAESIHFKTTSLKTRKRAMYKADCKVVLRMRATRSLHVNDLRDAMGKMELFKKIRHSKEEKSPNRDFEYGANVDVTLTPRPKPKKSDRRPAPKPEPDESLEDEDSNDGDESAAEKDDTPAAPDSRPASRSAESAGPAGDEPSSDKAVKP